MNKCCDKLRSALKLLHDNLAEYQRLNYLDGYDNDDMVLARAALSEPCSCGGGQIFWGSVNDNGCICCCYPDEALARKAFAEVSGHVRLIKLQEIVEEKGGDAPCRSELLSTGAGQFNPEPAPNRWIPYSERPPTEEDGVEVYGLPKMIWVKTAGLPRLVEWHHSQLSSTHWTRIILPPPPEPVDEDGAAMERLLHECQLQDDDSQLAADIRRVCAALAHARKERK